MGSAPGIRTAAARRPILRACARSVSTTAAPTTRGARRRCPSRSRRPRSSTSSRSPRWCSTRDDSAPCLRPGEEVFRFELGPSASPREPALRRWRPCPLTYRLRGIRECTFKINAYDPEMARGVSGSSSISGWPMLGSGPARRGPRDPLLGLLPASPAPPEILDDRDTVAVVVDGSGRSRPRDGAVRLHGPGPTPPAPFRRGPRHRIPSRHRGPHGPHGRDHRARGPPSRALRPCLRVSIRPRAAGVARPAARPAASLRRRHSPKVTPRRSLPAATTTAASAKTVTAVSAIALA